MRITWLLAAVCAVSVVGCNEGPSGSDGGDGGADAGPTVDEACAQEAATTCAKFDECGADGGAAVRYGDLATCLSRVKGNCATALAAPGTGRTVADVIACAGARPTESCVAVDDNDPPTACRTRPGAGALGSPCLFPAQCQSAFCSTPRNAACGTCAAAPAAGAQCATTAQCDYNQSCVTRSTDGGVIVDAVCTVFGVADAGCSSDQPCGGAMSCVGSANLRDGGVQLGTCQPQGTTVGVGCDPRLRTAPGCVAALNLFCSTVTLTCQQEARVGAGAPCGLVDAGVRNACTAATTCEPAAARTGTCTAPAGDGAACDTAAGPGCLRPARCVTDGGSGGVCVLPDGAACH